jgi:hypothetical protein
MAAHAKLVKGRVIPFVCERNPSPRMREILDARARRKLKRRFRQGGED